MIIMWSRFIQEMNLKFIFKDMYFIGEKKKNACETDSGITLQLFCGKRLCLPATVGKFKV